MLKVELYVQEHRLQYENAQNILNEYMPVISWMKPSKNTVMDIGCGPGDVTWNILRPKLPPDTQIIGVDISNEMLKYMKENYEKIQPLQLDIGSNEVPNNLLGSVDQIFSFYCLHWVPNQRQAMQNIFDLLKPGGHLLTFYAVNDEMYNIFNKLSKTKKWRKHLTDDFYTGISLLQNTTNPENNLQSILNEIGFNVKICKCEKRHFDFRSTHDFRRFVDSICAHKFESDDLRTDFLTDCIQEFFSFNNSSTNIVFPNKVLVICAMKE